MSSYIIKPGNIAAMCHVVAPDGTTTDCIYLSEKTQPVIDMRDTPLDKSGLPLAVRAAVNRHFGIIFALPVERRGEYLANSTNWLIEATP